MSEEAIRTALVEHWREIYLSETVEGTEDDMGEDCPQCEGSGEDWIEEEDDD